MCLRRRVGATFRKQNHRSKHTLNVLATQARSPAKCYRGSSWQGHRASFLFAIVLFDTLSIDSTRYDLRVATSFIHVVRFTTPNGIDTQMKRLFLGHVDRADNNTRVRVSDTVKNGARIAMRECVVGECTGRTVICASQISCPLEVSYERTGDTGEEWG
ncbi:hypothetical protein BGY98DRAFT_94234 [Russula aff. rugulosa BPL654]|nr:hypothetical protein BGY98DRAFT_94234 [Russula aff. rugulosa BPL654]